jgi:hypothetical protein
LHSENVALEVPCHTCDRSDCDNKLHICATEIRRSELLLDENGLFATRNIKKGEWIASFGPLKPVTEGVEGDLGYSIPIRETGTRKLVYVEPFGELGTMSKAHAMNHTCCEKHRNTELAHTGELGQRTQVLVRACKDIEVGRELFTTYGPKDEIGFFDEHPCRCHSCRLPTQTHGDCVTAQK